MRYVLVMLFCCGSLFAQIEERTFADINITEAYKEVRLGNNPHTYTA